MPSLPGMVSVGKVTTDSLPGRDTIGIQS